MSRARKIAQGPSSLDLIEEVFHCLRRVPGPVWFIYYGGTLPFILGVLYFWADMSRGAFAGERLLGSTLVMTVLFLFMKTCHCRFTAHLTARLCGRPTATWGIGGWLGVSLRQTFWQPLGLMVLPIALIIFAPFGWAYAFFQNITVLDHPGATNRTLFARAWRQTLLWPGQNHSGLAALKGFALFVFLDLMLAVLAVPKLLKLLLGIESTFSRLMTDLSAILLTVFNTTFLSVILCLTYLCVDPLLKTFYVLRCFYGESLRTGQDLEAELVRWRPNPALAAGLLALACLFLGSSTLRSAPAQPPARPAQVESSELDRAIQDVLAGREYRWRLPRAQTEVEHEKGALELLMDELTEMAQNGLKAAGGWIRKAVNFLTKGRLGGGLSTGPGWHAALRAVLILLVFALVFMLVLLAVRMWRQRTTPIVHAAPVLTAPDLSDEDLAADQLPEEGWLEIARQLMANGELRLALRAFYLASLAHLAGRQFITIAKFKSNLEYQRELERRGHVFPDLTRVFADNVQVFDRVWYGLHQVDGPLLDGFSRNVEEIRRTV